MSRLTVVKRVPPCTKQGPSHITSLDKVANDLEDRGCALHTSLNTVHANLSHDTKLLGITLRATNNVQELDEYRTIGQDSNIVEPQSEDDSIPER